MLIDLAIVTAARAHKNQIRKGSGIPYITHPFSVGMLLLREGCPDEVVAAGILHDTVEDTSITLENIRENFGDRVASIVRDCSEPDRSLSWEERKRHTIEFLKTAPPEVKLVACADKLHNIRTMVREYEDMGNRLWERFKRGRSSQAWYYRGLVESLCTESHNPGHEILFQQFREEVEKLFSEKKHKEVIMKKVDYMAVAEKAMTQIKKGAFLTVKAGEAMNTMTIGWATMGYVWRKPIMMVAVRDSRFTFGIIEKAADFTVSVPLTDMNDAVMFCGTKSGRDVDKYKACNLELVDGQQVATPIIKTPGLHFECKIVYKSAMDPAHLIKEYEGLYPEKDYHTIYFGEIVACYEI